MPSASDVPRQKNDASLGVWCVALALSLFAHGILFSALQNTASSLAASAPKTALPLVAPPALTVSAVPIPDEWKVRIDISNAEPLFLSTPFNFGYIPPTNSADAMTDIDDGFLSAPFAPDLTLRNARLAVRRDASLGASPPPLQHLLPLQFWNAAATLGSQSPAKDSPLAPRRAWMRIENFATQEVQSLDGKPLELEAQLEFPRDADSSTWHPVAFSLLVDEFGAVGAALPLSNRENVFGSGNPAADAAIRRYLASSPAPFRKLPAGHYRILIGP